MSKTTPRPRDMNQLAKLMVDIATGQETDSPESANKHDKDPAAVSLGRRGGLKGGRSRAEKLTAEERANIARKAADKRWGKI